MIPLRSRKNPNSLAGGGNRFVFLGKTSLQMMLEFNEARPKKTALKITRKKKTKHENTYKVNEHTYRLWLYGVFDARVARHHSRFTDNYRNAVGKRTAASVKNRYFCVFRLSERIGFV